MTSKPGYKFKIHLFLPETKSLCATPDPQKTTTDPNLATCKRCLHHYENNKDWYAEQIRTSKCCKNCGREIKTMAFKGEDWCSGNCKKAVIASELPEYAHIWDKGKMTTEAYKAALEG